MVITESSFLEDTTDRLRLNMKSFEHGTLPILIYGYHHEQQTSGWERKICPCTSLLCLSVCCGFIYDESNNKTVQDAVPKLDGREDQCEKRH